MVTFVVATHEGGLYSSEDFIAASLLTTRIRLVEENFPDTVSVSLSACSIQATPPRSWVEGGEHKSEFLMLPVDAPTVVDRHVLQLFVKLSVTTCVTVLYKRIFLMSSHITCAAFCLEI